MTLDLYYAPFSPPCRAVMLTAEAIGITMNLIKVDLLNGEQLKPEYEQINPQKTVPLLIDDGYKLSERAIMIYLVNKYGKTERLYPKNAASRAVINRLLYFDMDRLYASIADYYYPVIFMGRSSYDPAEYANVKSAFEILDRILDGQDYVAGRSLTLADLAIVASVSTADALNFDCYKHRNVFQWYERMKRSAPGYRKANGEGADMWKEFLKKKD